MASEAPALRDEGKWYTLPPDEKDAIFYSATLVNRTAGGAYVHLWLEFSVWKKDDQTGRARFRRVVLQRDWEQPAPKDRPVDPEARPPLDGRKVAGQVMEFPWNPRGLVRQPIPDGAKFPNDETRDMAEVMLDDVFPVVFQALPKDFKPEKGFQWGKKEEDSLEFYTNHPDLKFWEVRDVLSLFPARNVVLLESMVKDNHQSSEGAKKIAFRRRSVGYDAAAKRVRSATEEQSYELRLGKDGVGREGQSSNIVIAEMPPPIVLPEALRPRGASETPPPKDRPNTGKSEGGKD